MTRRLSLTLALAAALTASPGCRTTRDSCAPASYFPPYVGPTPAAAPCDRCRQSAFPPPLVPVAPLPTTAAFPPAFTPGPVANLNVIQQGAYASAAPFDPSVRLSAPIADGPDAVRETTRLYGPVTQDTPAAPLPGPRDDRDASPPLPVDVPQFAVARDRVAAGLQPFPDGIAWLQAHHYRTVLHVRAPGEDDSAARRQFEKHDLRYISLEVSPTTLSGAVVEQFGRIVTEESNLPLFVYDKDGALAGGLWYLYFRTAEGASDEQARTEAVRLGLRPDQNLEHRTMWIAIQTYLRNLNP